MSWIFSYYSVTFVFYELFTTVYGKFVMPDVVNNALGLAQYITSCMNEEQALSYLLAVEPLTLQDWKTSRALLTDANITNRQTKEKFIEDIIYVFKNTPPEDDYLVKDLSILPGLSRFALQLISYSNANLYAIDIALKSSSQPAQGTINLSSRSTAQEVNTQQINQHREALNVNFPPLSALQGESPQSNGSPAPSGGQWNTRKRNNQNRNNASGQFPSKKVAPKKQKTVVHGTSPSGDTDKTHPLTFVCIGVRSGENETTTSLKEVLNQWKCLKDLKVEAVRTSYHSSTFRVQFNIPTALQMKWKDPASWPARITAFEWRGNPKATLKPLSERLYTKRIYIGNLPSTATEQIIKDNMNQIYENEIKDNRIQKIEVYWNSLGIERTTLKRSQDPSLEMKRSACVVLTSHPGQSLDHVTLKLDHYIPEIRRTVRRWNGQIPLPQKQPEINLNWC